MAAPKFTPVSPLDTARGYASPDHVPDPWTNDRPGAIAGRQPVGERLGFQGPDQGYGLKLAAGLRPSVLVQDGESVDDALAGTTAIGMRRASLFGRAPVIHDLRIALTIWGFLDAAPPDELVAQRRLRFLSVGARGGHAYPQLRALVDQVPDATLRSTPDQIAAAYPNDWRTLTGC